MRIAYLASIGFSLLCFFQVPSRADVLAELDLASDQAWTLSLDDGPPRPIKVPGGGWNSDLQSPRIAWGAVRDHATYVRAFTVPTEAAGKALVLRFGTVNFGCEVFVNGKSAGGHDQPTQPFDLDITGLAQAGATCSLKVVVYTHDHYGSGALHPFDYDYYRSKSDETAKFPLGIAKSVRLEVHPLVRIGEVWARGSVRGNSLTYDAWITNDDGISHTVRLGGSLSSWNGGPFAYPSLPPATVTLAPRETRKVTAGPVAWGLGATSYWWPNIPFREDYRAQLHNLSLDLAEGSTALDHKVQRFGFCEYGEGPYYYTINGARINYISDATPEGVMSLYDNYGRSPAFLPPSGGSLGCPETWKKYMRLGFNSLRVHQSTPTEYMLQAADEVGFMLEGETGIRGYTGENWDDSLTPGAVRGLIRAIRTHPCVVRYSLSNEFGADKRLIDAATLEDTTRPYSFDVHTNADGDAGKVVSGRFHAWKIQHYADIPDRDTTLIRGIGEFGWINFRRFPDALVEMAVRAKNEFRPRDAALYSPWCLANFWPNLFEGMDSATHGYTMDDYPDRKDGVTGWNSPVIRHLQKANAPYLALDIGLETDNQDFSADWPSKVPTLKAGATVVRDLDLYNNGLGAGKLQAAWELHWDAPDGPAAGTGQAPAFNLPAGFHQPQDATFTCPNPGRSAARPLYFILKNTLDGQEVYREERYHFLVEGGSTGLADGDPGPQGWKTAGNDLVLGCPSGKTYRVEARDARGRCAVRMAGTTSGSPVRLEARSWPEGLYTVSYGLGANGGSFALLKAGGELFRIGAARGFPPRFSDGPH